MISYNWGVQKTVLKLASTLKAKGYAVWLDTEKMMGSKLDAMASAIENSWLVLICVTEKYKDSPACRLEGEYCSTLRKPFIPLILEKGYKPNGWLGILLGSKMYYSFADESGWDSNFTNLNRAITTIKEQHEPHMHIEEVVHVETNASPPSRHRDVFTPRSETSSPRVHPERYMAQSHTGIPVPELSASSHYYSEKYVPQSPDTEMAPRLYTETSVPRLYHTESMASIKNPLDSSAQRGLASSTRSLTSLKRKDGVASWSAEQVGEWLKNSDDLADYAPVFVKNQITGRALMVLARALLFPSPPSDYSYCVRSAQPILSEFKNPGDHLVFIGELEELFL